MLEYSPVHISPSQTPSNLCLLQSSYSDLHSTESSLLLTHPSFFGTKSPVTDGKLLKGAEHMPISSRLHGVSQILCHVFHIIWTEDILLRMIILLLPLYAVRRASQNEFQLPTQILSHSKLVIFSQFSEDHVVNTAKSTLFRMAVHCGLSLSAQSSRCGGINLIHHIFSFASWAPALTSVSSSYFVVLPFIRAVWIYTVPFFSYVDHFRHSLGSFNPAAENSSKLLLYDDVSPGCETGLIMRFPSSSSSVISIFSSRGWMIFRALDSESRSVANTWGRQPLWKKTCPALAIRWGGHTLLCW